MRTIVLDVFRKLEYNNFEANMSFIKGVKMSKRFPVDVILQHNTDGTIIPIRLRFTNNDGERVDYTIKGYKDLSGQETRTMPDRVYVTSNDLVYQCKLIVNNQQRLIYLHRDPSGKSWFMTVIS